MTNKQIQLIAGLSDVKQRRRTGLFKAEGLKCVTDTIGHFELRHLYATVDASLPPDLDIQAERVSRGEMQRMSSQVTTPPLIAVYAIPDSTQPPLPDELSLTTSDLIIALDCVQDPGNLGTIIRLADWFGIKNIFCTPDTVDVYNHKVVQATMGAISHVKVHYCDIGELIAQYPDIPVYGTFLDGDNIYRQQVENRGFVIFGNEGKGISPQLAGLVSRRLLIPAFAASGEAPESLNVGVAAAITISEFRRRTVQ